MSKITVEIADDDPALAGALADTVMSTHDLELVAVASDADTAISAAVQHRPEVVLMDVKMPGGGGVFATTVLIAQVPGVKVIGLSAHEDQAAALQMLEAGAVAYIVKGMPAQEILDAVRRARRGQFSMPAELAVATFRDLLVKLRAQAKSEATLRPSDGRVHEVLDAMPDALVLVDQNGTVEFANCATQQLFGYGPGELTGRNVLVLVPERFQEMRKAVERAFNDHRSTPPTGKGLPLFGRRKNGSEFPADISFKPFMTRGGMAFLATVRDTIESRETDEVLRKSEQMFRGLLESAPDAMVVTDDRGRIQIANTRTEQLFGYSREEILGRSVDSLVPKRLRGVHASHRAKYITDPKVRPMGRGLELLGRRRDGTEFPVDISLSPMQTDDGLLVIAAVRDVTNRKLDERQISESNELAQRRRLMAHLVRVQEEERRKIAGDIHDDSIQAMTAVSLRMQLLRRELANERHRELVGKLEEDVGEAITRLRRLLFDLRPPTLDRAGLGAALRELLDRSKVEGGFEYVLDDRLAEEPAQDIRIEIFRIAQEAFVNVRKHAQARNVHIEMRQIDHGYRTSVSDDGRGFDVTDSAGRTGHLGLLAMRERAQIAGGWLTIDSHVGGGSIVDFWLPAS